MGEVFKQVINSGDAMIVAIGLFMIFFAIAIRVFKQYWLIAGVNTASKRELGKIDLEYVGKYFGIYIGLLGFFFLSNPFVFRYFNTLEYSRSFLALVSLVIVSCMFIHGHLKKDRIYKRK